MLRLGLKVWTLWRRGVVKGSDGLTFQVLGGPVTTERYRGVGMVPLKKQGVDWRG